MAGIFQFFTTILARIAEFASWIIAVIKRVFLDMFAFVQDCFCWLLDGLLGIAIGALDAIEIPFDPSTYYALIPADLASVLGYVGIPQALSIIVSALVVRFLLQTIPFVRWGS